MLLPLLAEADPSAVNLKTWFEVLVYIAVGIAAVAHAHAVLTGKNNEREIGPSPLVVQQHAGQVTDAELREVHGRIKREREELNRDIAALAAEDTRLRERLDRDIGDLHERINDVPARVISLLRETKGLI